MLGTRTVSRDRLAPSRRRLAPVASLSLVVLVGASSCGDFELVEFTRATTTTVPVEAVPTTLVTPTASTTTTLRPARYTVLPGDSLGSIAAKFDVNMEALMQANGITDASDIRAGQDLVMPDPGATVPPPWQQREEAEQAEREANEG